MTDDVLTIRVNGEAHRLVVDGHRTLLEVIRESLGLTGTKFGCELGECGACTVLIDGVSTLSCLTLVSLIGDAEVTTVEGLSNGNIPHPLQETFAELGAAQCGYCTPGMLVAAKALLDRESDPSREQIKSALAGNLCRCTGFVKILDAVALAAARS